VTYSRVRIPLGPPRTTSPKLRKLPRVHARFLCMDLAGKELQLEDPTYAIKGLL